MSIGEPTSEEAIQNYVSRLYPTRYSGSGDYYHRTIVAEMLRSVTPAMRVLDVGCGIGYISRLYPTYDITGIDISDGMLAQHPGKWLKAPAEAIPFPNDAFNVVLCRSLLHHLEEPQVGLDEMARVLKPGGQWVCWEPNLSVFNDWVRWLARKTQRFSHWHKNFAPEELRRLVACAGLHIQRVTYQGFLAYPLLGFPDIWRVPVPQQLWGPLMRVDDWLSKTPVAPMGWAVMIEATR